MKKLIALVLVGLVIGMAGAMGIVITREKQARAAAALLAATDSAVADSLHAERSPPPPDSVGGDSVATHTAVLDSTVSGAASIADSLTSPAAPREESQPNTGPEEPATNLRTVSVSNPESPDEERLARIFAAMRPDQAALVLEQMTDGEIRLLLSHLRERQAAAIMSSISPERAAVISSAVIRGGRGTP